MKQKWLYVCGTGWFQNWDWLLRRKVALMTIFEFKIVKFGNHIDSYEEFGSVPCPARMSAFMLVKNMTLGHQYIL